MTQANLERRICYHYPYVAPATILSADSVDDQDTSSLRTDASTNGACYLEVIRSFHDGTYQARVAAHPNLIRTRGYTVVLNAAYLALAQPLDCRILDRAA